MGERLSVLKIGRVGGLEVKSRDERSRGQVTMTRVLRGCS